MQWQVLFRDKVPYDYTIITRGSGEQRIALPQPVVLLPGVRYAFYIRAEESDYGSNLWYSLSRNTPVAAVNADFDSVTGLLYIEGAFQPAIKART